MSDSPTNSPSAPTTASASANRVGDRPILRVAALVALFLAIAVAVGLAIAPAAGAASVQDDGTNGSANDSNATAPTELQPIDVANASGNDTEPITFSGEGQTVTDQFELDDGLLVAAYDHDGESNFWATLWNESTDEAVIDLMNEIGSVEGTSAEGVTAGNYSLEINADGAWNVTLVQPNTTAAIAAQAGNATGENASADGTDGNTTDGDETDGNGTAGNATDGDDTTEAANGSNATTIASAPAVASGNGSVVVGPVNFTESVTATANHSGESNFQVTVYEESATSFLDAAYVYNEIGQVEAAETRVEPTGLSWVVVTADGEWDLRFEER